MPATDAIDASNVNRFAPGIPGVIQNNSGLNYQSGIMGSTVTPPTFGNVPLNPSVFPQQGISTLGPTIADETGFGQAMSEIGRRRNQELYG